MKTQPSPRKRRLKALVFAAAVGGLGFWAGRWTAPAPRFEPAAVNEESGRDPLPAAFAEFIRAQQDTMALLRQSPFFGDAQERAEAYRGLLYALVGSIKTSVLQSPDHPRFMRAVDWTSKSGLDNPDNNYYVAVVREDADYRIFGNRGNTSDLVFQLLVGEPGVRDAGSSTNISLLEDEDLRTDAEGNFEIILSRKNPGPGRNWLPNGDGARTLIVRYTYGDWSAERDGLLRIERIGAEGAHAKPLTPEQMAFRMREAAVSLYDRTATWQSFARRSWELRPRNGIAPPSLTRGGLVGQYSAFGSWELGPEDALLLSTTPSNADYQGIQLGNLWFISLDYESRTSSLNLRQMHCPPEGHCYAVISHRDPGIQNWLDTEGHRRGLIMLRWHGLEGSLPEATYPTAELVPFADLRVHLPEDVPSFSEAQRREQIRERRAAVQTRR